MDVHCPTCGQPCSPTTQDSHESQAAAIRSLFLQRGVEVTKGEARFLAVLRGRNRPVARTHIMDLLYGFRADGECPEEKILDVWVCKIKPKIEKSKLPWKLVTHYGLGYELREGQTKPILFRTACALMILLPLGQVLVSRLL